MTTKIEICNLALAQIGQESISSLTQEDERARRCDLFYEPVKREVLRTHNWGFAGTLESLALVKKLEKCPLRYIYRYPADALFIRKVLIGGRGHVSAAFKEGFDRAINARVLLTDAAEAWAEYTKDIRDEGMFDAAFVKSFSLALAVDLAIPLTGDNTLAQLMFKKYTLSIEEARRSNMSERQDVKTPSSVFIEAR